MKLSNRALGLIVCVCLAAAGWIATRDPGAGPLPVVAPQVAGHDIAVLSGSCDIPSADGAAPAGCALQSSRRTPVIHATATTLPLDITASVLSITVASGPVPDAISLVATTPGHWQLEFPDAPAGRYRVLLTTDVAQVAEFILDVPALEAKP